MDKSTQDINYDLVEYAQIQCLAYKKIQRQKHNLKSYSFIGAYLSLHSNDCRRSIETLNT